MEKETLADSWTEVVETFLFRNADNNHKFTQFVMVLQSHDGVNNTAEITYWILWGDFQKFIINVVHTEAFPVSHTDDRSHLVTHGSGKFKIWSTESFSLGRNAMEQLFEFWKSGFLLE